jgi:hypothetical protein
MSCSCPGDHDKKPSAFFVYVYLAVRVEREMTRGIEASYSIIATATGLSKTAVQKAIAHLKERKLISVLKTSATSTPVYGLNRHWLQRLRSA